MKQNKWLAKQARVKRDLHPAKKPLLNSVSVTIIVVLLVLYCIASRPNRLKTPPERGAVSQSSSQDSRPIRSMVDPVVARLLAESDTEFDVEEMQLHSIAFKFPHPKGTYCETRFYEDPDPGEGYSLIKIFDDKGLLYWLELEKEQFPKIGSDYYIDGVKEAFAAMRSDGTYEKTIEEVLRGFSLQCKKIYSITVEQDAKTAFLIRSATVSAYKGQDYSLCAYHGFLKVNGYVFSFFFFYLYEKENDDSKERAVVNSWFLEFIRLNASD